MAGCRKLPGSVGVYIRKDPQTSPREFNEEHVQVIQVGGDMFFPENERLEPDNESLLEQERHRTRNHQLLGFQLSIFVGMLISGMCLGRIGMFPLMKMRFLFGVPKTYLPKSALSTRFAFFVGGRGKKNFALSVPPFPR